MRREGDGLDVCITRNRNLNGTIGDGYARAKPDRGDLIARDSFARLDVVGIE
ncbi:MAG: hypothetical protein M3Q28_00500 [Pseudomonadota bacterium]|nr:hypothetical protein [Pseudomonadota bacterium]